MGANNSQYLGAPNEDGLLEAIQELRLTTPSSSSAATSPETRPGTAATGSSAPTTMAGFVWETAYTVIAALAGSYLLIAGVLVTIALCVLLNHKDPITGRTYYQVSNPVLPTHFPRPHCLILM